MDSPGIPPETLARFHRDLERVHLFLGTYSTLARAISVGTPAPRSVLDIGCGAGALLKYLKARLGLEIVGVDRVAPPAPDFPFVQADACSDPLPAADVAVTTFVAHHLTPEENIALIRNVARSCRRFVILDLVRHPLPLALFTVFLCPLIAREAGADGRQSIRRAFTPEEFAEIARAAVAGTHARIRTDVSPFRSRQIIDIQFS